MHLDSCNWNGSGVVVCQDIATNANMVCRQNKVLQDLTVMWHWIAWQCTYCSTLPKSGRPDFAVQTESVFPLMFHPDLVFLCDDSASLDALTWRHMAVSLQATTHWC